jgi:hypothetical protein
MHPAIVPRRFTSTRTRTEKSDITALRMTMLRFTSALVHAKKR